jgi:hypothetical protein
MLSKEGSLDRPIMARGKLGCGGLPWEEIMHRFLAYVALMSLWSPSGLQAQTPATADIAYSEGAVPSDPDYERSLPLVRPHRAFLPVSVDLSSRMPAPGNQGKLGSCTAWAVAYAARSYYSSALERRDIRLRTNLPSPNYIFHLARTESCAAGSNIARTIEVMQKGALSLRDYPYSELCLPPAPPALVEKANDFRVRGVKRVDFSNIDNIKGQLAQSNPVVFQFLDTKGFMAHRGAGVFSEQIPAGVTPTYHEMVFIGYDDRRQALRLVNSWGSAWGDNGYAWLSYDLVKTRVGHAYTLDVAPPQELLAHQNPGPEPAKTEPISTPSKPPTAPTQPPPQKPNPPAVQQTQVNKPALPPTPVLPPSPQVPVAPARQANLSDLAKLSCAKVAVQNRNGQNLLLGFVGSSADLELVQQIATNVPNTSAESVVLAPWPQCEALLTLEKPLVASDSPGLAIDSAEMRAGDILKITVRSPSQISYLYVAYIQADGSVVQLAQPNGIVAQPTLPNQTLVFGDGLQNRPKFTIGPPFGPEMIIAVASRSPLFDAQLPPTQTEREYLTALRRALIYKPSPELPDREVTAAIKMLQTSAR